MTKQLTIRGVTAELGRRLTRLSRERGQSVNTTTLAILEAAVGIDARRDRLRRYATWAPHEAAEFDQALADQRVIDDELWPVTNPSAAPSTDPLTTRASREPGWRSRQR